MDMETKYQKTMDFLKVLMDEKEEVERSYGDYETYEKSINKYKQEVDNQQKEINKYKEELEEYEKNLESLNETAIKLVEENGIISSTKDELKKRVAEMKEDFSIVEKEKKELERQIKKLRENVKKPAVIESSKDVCLDLFEQLKNGSCVSWLSPRSSSYAKKFDNSFVFEYDNKGAVYFQKELIGMYEKRGNCVKYYQEKHVPNNALAESILKNVLKIKGDAYHCKLKHGRGSGQTLKNIAYNQILKKEPRFNTMWNKFESEKYYQYIYTEADGCKYIIKNGKKEYI